METKVVAGVVQAVERVRKPSDTVKRKQTHVAGVVTNMITAGNMIAMTTLIAVIATAPSPLGSLIEIMIRSASFSWLQQRRLGSSRRDYRDHYYDDCED